ncbi:carbonic anhydrase [Qipengyuania huizhouensis]|uniref:carbonic anhydrase n=1 Tax=Qipengyuania huizhouensis TaxID=2867245 RepID=UPI001A3ABCD8|nr:carbonic anhydrase [Qipengyuania huizhouensis]MBL4858342.1 carbonic anhydrase [Erythrobacter sp.]MBX7460541.1 carbonic anhydrase [Qipengyuania huizhouensis]
MKTFEQMIEGYRKFRATEWREERERWKALAEGQSPQVMVISCSDSRVDPAQILGVAPGEIFVVRNVAALVPPFETTPGRHGVSAAVEFAVQFLKVREIVVMGHGLCGGCKAALTQDLHGNEIGEGGFVAHWVDMLDEAREPIAATLGTEGRDAELAMELEAVKVSLANLVTFPYVAEKVDSGELTLRGAHFAISDGILRVLDNHTGKFVAAD